MATPQKLRTTVERIERLSETVKHFRLRLPAGAALDFTPGQFIIVHLPKDDTVIKRAYSIASPPHDSGVIELCIQIMPDGRASSIFDRLEVGNNVLVDGPHGRFTLKQPIDYDPVFLATGTGVAPFRSMIYNLFQLRTNRQVWLLLGVRYEDGILYHPEFTNLARIHRNFHYVPTVSRPMEWKGEKGHVQDSFKRSITVFAHKEFYVCGWVNVAREIVRDLVTLGVPREEVHYEEW